ncbi:MAG TPA: sortase [Candidatus Dormibacteraeota bacterium]
MALSALALALSACGATEPTFGYGSGVKLLPGDVAPTSGGWISDGRPPAQQFPPPLHETPVATITIADLGLNAIPIFDRDLNVQGRMSIATGYSITRYKRSAGFGAQSNTVLYGHDDIQGAVFGKLSQLKIGELIQVQVTGGPLITYQVTRAPTIIPPTYLTILKPTATPQLTLFTCYPLWQDDHRVFVVAKPVS